MILIANIGSRNLKSTRNGAKAQDLADAFSKADFPQFYPDGERFNFRACTAYLADLANLPAFAEELVIEIFTKDTLLLTSSTAAPRIQDVYLITSDQDEPKHRHSDTLHVGEIIQQLRARIGVAQVTLLRYEGNPADEAALFAALPELLRPVLKMHEGETIRFCDAGGTSQQKSVVKELLRYYVPPGKLEIRYPPNDPAAEVRDVNSPLHDKYVQLRVAKRFVEAYDYAGALRALADVEIGDSLMGSLLVAKHRKTFDLDSARCDAQNYGIPESAAILHRYLNDEPPVKAVNFPLDLPATDRRHILELGALVELHLRQKDYPLAIALYFRLCEQLGQSFKRNKALNIPSELAKPEVQQKINDLTHIEVVDKKKDAGVPALLGVAYALGSSEFRSVVKLIAPTINILNRHYTNGLNTIRNQSFFAHQPEAVTLARIEGKKGCPGFVGPTGRAEKILRALGVPTGPNSVYDQMNDALLHLFQQE